MMTLPTGFSILLVDDTPSNLDTLVAMLEHAYELRVATSGAAALSLLASGPPPDLILLDVMMPGMDGYEVHRALRSQPATRDIPVVFITAKTDADSETRALEGGAADFIHKPINRAVLLARVRLQLDLKRYRDHLEDMVQARTLELARARDGAESASRAKTAFLMTMSHELRTPMNQIMGMAQLLARDVSSERGQDRLSKLQAASGHLLELIDAILDYARLESETLEIVSAEFDLPALLASVRERFAPAAADKGIELAVSVDPGLPVRLMGDAERIRKALENLMSNAIKFSDRGDVTVQVRQTGAHRNAVMVRFEVSDEGIGMSAQVRAGLFEAFRQGEDSLSRRFGGAGLGLALTRRLVTLMGGEIGVDSEPGQGSDFWFSLPLAVAGAPGSARASHEDAGA